MRITIYLLAVVFTVSTAANADTVPGELIMKLDKEFATTPYKVRTSNVEGIFEIIANNKVYYTDSHGGFILVGDLINLENHVNETKVTREKIKAEQAIQSAKTSKVSITSYLASNNEKSDMKPNHVTNNAKESLDERGLRTITGSPGCKARIQRNNYSAPVQLKQRNVEGISSLLNTNTTRLEKIGASKDEPLDRMRQMSEWVKSRPTDTMIVYPAKGETKRIITALIDIKCPYCKKLYKDVEKYNESGVEVRFMAFPLQGLTDQQGKMTQAAQNLVSIWCSDDKKDALRQAFNGRVIATNKTCEFQIASHFKLGLDLNIKQTPLLLTSTGNTIQGYFPAEQVIKVMDHTDSLLARPGQPRKDKNG